MNSALPLYQELHNVQTHVDIILTIHTRYHQAIYMFILREKERDLMFAKRLAWQNVAVSVLVSSS